MRPSHRRTGVPGVGFEVYDITDGANVFLDFVDPYSYPADVADKCAGVTPPPPVTPAPPAVSPGLPDTGTNAAGMGLAALLVISLGGTLVAASRRTLEVRD